MHGLVAIVFFLGIMVGVVGPPLVSMRNRDPMRLQELDAQHDPLCQIVIWTIGLHDQLRVGQRWSLSNAGCAVAKRFDIPSLWNSDLTKPTRLEVDHLAIHILRLHVARGDA